MANRGVNFNGFDKLESEPVGLVSMSLARRRWKNEDPIGQRVTFDEGEHWVRIMGIVGDVHEFGPTHEVPEQFYRPMFQAPNTSTVLVRSAGDPEAISNEVRRAIHELEPEMAIVKVETLDQARADTVASPRTITRLLGLYAGLALLIAAIGNGSMLALWVRQRTREIGIRIALGASPGDILSKLVRQGMVLVLVGLAAGRQARWR